MIGSTSPPKISRRPALPSPALGDVESYRISPCARAAPALDLLGAGGWWEPPLTLTYIDFLTPLRNQFS